MPNLACSTANSSQKTEGTQPKNKQLEYLFFKYHETKIWVVWFASFEAYLN